MKWILFYLNQFDYIIYISSLNPQERHSIPYTKFFNFLSQHISNIENLLDLENSILKYRYIMLYDTGKWEVLKPDTTTYSYDDLFSFNIDKVESKKNSHQKKSFFPEFFQNKINKSKNYLFSLSKNNTKKF